MGVRTRESVFYTRHGQFIYGEPAGLDAGYDWPQYSIHRGDLQMALLAAVRERLGADSVVTDARCIGVDQDESGVTARFADNDGTALPPVRAAIGVGCDGIHSALRKQFYPDEGAPRYSGVNMWRGTTRRKPFLSGASMVRAGWLSIGKMVIYPIRDDIDAEGNQLVNWVAEIEAPQPAVRDWTPPGPAGGLLPGLRRLALRLAGRGRPDPQGRRHPGVPHGRPGSAAHLDARPRHAAGRRRAPDGAARLPTARGRR